MRFLVVDCETADKRDARCASVGRAGGDSFAQVLRELRPGCNTAIITPADGDGPPPTPAELAEFDAVFLGGSSLHVYDGSAPSERLIDAMRAVYRSGTPSFGSCAGLQVAVVAAGGEVGPADDKPEAGIARRITPTQAGRDHPLLRDRPPVWDALTIHTDEITRLPDGATLLAVNSNAMHAAEIRHDGGLCWGVQYHPELTLREIAAALRRDAAMVVEHGLSRTELEVGGYADLLATLGSDGGRTDLAWRLGIDEQVLDDAQRRREIRNFLDHLHQA